jgi:FlaA1/EpsC-like NDP-sugar epimerase
LVYALIDALFIAFLIENRGVTHLQKLFIFLLGLSRPQKIAFQWIVDSVVMGAAFVLAIWLRTDSLSLLANPLVWFALLGALPGGLLVFHAFGVYRAVIRYIAARAVQTMLLGAVVSGFAMALTATFFQLPMPRSVPLIYSLLVFLGVGATRYVFRESAQKAQSRRKERVAVYGSGAAGRQLVQTLLQGNDYLPIALIDDDPSVQSSLVSGLRVYAPAQIEHLIRNNGISSVLLAMPSASKARRSDILKSLEHFPLHLRTIPGLHDIVSGRSKIDEVNEISIEDLLGRDPVPPRPEFLGANITGKSVMVTGAGGSIGSELCRLILRQAPTHLVLFELSELALYSIEQELTLYCTRDHLRVQIVPVLGSVQNRVLVERTLRRFDVQTVYHAAAYKHVPLVEHNVAEGIRNNVLGTKAVVEAAIAAGVEAFTLISTDKAVRPTNIMGASKRLAELVCQAAALAPSIRTKISMVRFGNVLGSSGSVIPLFRRQIAAGGPITVTHPEITRFFMTITEAAQLVIQAGALARGGDVFVLDMGEPVRIAELAARMARLHGLKPVLLLGGKAIARGEIGISFTKLRPGEKLFEELLIGNNPQPTIHPRIMTATERHLPIAELAQKLDLIVQACDRSDVTTLRRLLVEAQTAYAPQGDIVDHFEIAEGQVAPHLPERASADAKHLTLVRK